MRFTKHKGRPYLQPDWAKLDAVVLRLRNTEHLRIYPDSGTSIEHLQRLLTSRYVCTTSKRRHYVILTNREGEKAARRP